ncbi:hypothetical protein LCGC14_0371900 [marine sediment metagenome]|uniref:Uncharacterized protein n=1 Tax=marine sediment metagenome TaxID=412755 RepID=A0A0F9WDP7_9ZZZZ
MALFFFLKYAWIEAIKLLWADVKKMAIPKTRNYKKLVLEVSLDIKAMGKPSMNPKFKKEICSIINKYYPNWKTVSYEFMEA